MTNGMAFWGVGSLLIAVLGWIVYQVNNNTKTNKNDEKRLTAVETDIGWIRKALERIEGSLDKLLKG